MWKGRITAPAGTSGRFIVKFVPILIALLSAFAAWGDDLRDWMEDRELWQRTPVFLAQKYAANLKWQDRSKQTLVSVQRDFTFLDDPVWSLVIRLDDAQKITRIEGTLFTRGDAALTGETLDDVALRTKRRRLDAALRKLGAPEPEHRRTNLGGAQILTDTYCIREDLYVQLVSGESRKAVEYFQFRIAPKFETVRDEMRAEGTPEALAARLKTLPDGGKYVDVPMVDQGMKGYCVAATAERLVRYFGGEIDQHIFAQLAQSDALRGTSLRQAVKALEKIDARLNLRFRMLYEYSAFNTPGDLEKMIRQYNQEAKRAKVDAVRYNDFIQSEGNYRLLNYSGLLKALDPKVYRAFRLRDARDYRAFRQNITSSIDQGIPLAWGVGGPYKGGVIRHLRIINGYNPTKDEVIYTDSWGPGHERNTMPFEEAWSLTTELFSLTLRPPR